MKGWASLSVARSDEDGEDDGARVVVLIDESPATDESLRRAIAIARRFDALLTIVAYTPGTSRDGDSLTDPLEDALRAAQAEAEVAGVAAERTLLRGPHPLAQMRDLIAPAPSRDTLVLCSPALVTGPLRVLSRSLLSEPPCTLHVVSPPAGLRDRVLGWLARRVAGAR